MMQMRTTMKPFRKPPFTCTKCHSVHFQPAQAEGALGTTSHHCSQCRPERFMGRCTDTCTWL